VRSKLSPLEFKEMQTKKWKEKHSKNGKKKKAKTIISVKILQRTLTALQVVWYFEYLLHLLTQAWNAVIGKEIGTTS
jgi:hypothetical protein